MDTSESKIIERGTLFYNQYQHSINAYLFEASVLRSQRGGHFHDHENLDINIQFRESILQRNINYGGSWTGNYTRRGRGFTEDDILALHETLDWVTSDKKEKVIFYNNWIQIYTNDFESLKEQEFWQYLRHIKIKTAKISHAPNVIKLRNPKYSLRHYFREGCLDQENQQRLIRFLDNYRAEIRLGPALKEYTIKSYRYFTSNLFFDTNNPNIRLLFEISFPRMIRKTYHIEPR